MKHLDIRPSVALIAKWDKLGNLLKIVSRNLQGINGRATPVVVISQWNDFNESGMAHNYVLSICDCNNVCNFESNQTLFIR